MATLLNESNFNGQAGSYFKLSLEYDKVLNQNENNHTITYYLYFESFGGYSGSGSPATGYINGVSVGTTSSIGKNQRLLLGTKTEVISHNSDLNADGTKTVSYSALIDTPWTLQDASVSGTFVLPKIEPISNIKVKVNGAWKKAIAYIKVNGVWKKATPYTKVNGVWKKGIN